MMCDNCLEVFEEKDIYIVNYGTLGFCKECSQWSIGEEEPEE